MADVKAKRELVRRLRNLATDRDAHAAARDRGLIEAADAIEATLPKVKTPGALLTEAVHKQGVYFGIEEDSGTQRKMTERLEAAAIDLGIKESDE
jgi:hypothetical protein